MLNKASLRHAVPRPSRAISRWLRDCGNRDRRMRCALGHGRRVSPDRAARLSGGDPLPRRSRLPSESIRCVCCLGFGAGQVVHSSRTGQRFLPNFLDASSLRVRMRRFYMLESDVLVIPITHASARLLSGGPPVPVLSARGPVREKSADRPKAMELAARLNY